MRIRNAAACGLMVCLCGCGAKTPVDEAAAPGQQGAELFAMRVSEPDVVGVTPSADADAAPPATEGEQDPADAAIVEYEQLLVKDLENPANADKILALANLYLQRHADYKRAAQWYQEWVSRYGKADNPQSSLIYVQLLSCYEQLKADSDYLATCRQMLKVFPPESQEYQYADVAMHGGDITARRRVRPEAPPVPDRDSDAAPVTPEVPEAPTETPAPALADTPASESAPPVQ